MRIALPCQITDATHYSILNHTKKKLKYCLSYFNLLMDVFFLLFRIDDHLKIRYLKQSKRKKNHEIIILLEKKCKRKK